MGKSLECAARLQVLSSRIVSSSKSQRPKGTPNRVSTPRTSNPPSVIKVEFESLKNKKKMEPLDLQGEQCGTRTPLAKVVADCARRWFQDNLKEAKAGDRDMQVLVGQMYNSGYGVPRDPQKGHAWIMKASRGRNLNWKVVGKRPGYRASDSDSCELENIDKFFP